MANVDFIHLAKAPHGNRSLIDPFPANRVVQEPAKWVLTQNTDHNRARRGSKGGRRPFDKLGKVEKEDRLDLVLRHSLRLQGGKLDQPAYSQQQPEGESRHL